MIVTAALRALQILFSIIILGLSVTLINGQLLTSAPSQTDYVAFCGGWGILIGLIGVAAFFVERIQGLIMAALDGLTAILVVAGGIALAVSLGVHSCSDQDYLETNVIICGGGEIDGIPFFNNGVDLGARCHEAQADTAFLFFSFVTFLTTAVLSAMGRSGRTSSFV